ncbi:MAG: glycosyltransferase [Actinobacteria bacterium]|nr:glycosyltransferase [Actinomycetota bacterium]
MPRVSVIMPTYNAGARIGVAIGSVLTQSHRDVELVVVDDGSTDDTADIARAFGSRLTLLQQANAGPNAARNTGLRHATGDVIALCDSDDVLLPNYLADALAVLEAAPPRTWVTCASRLMTDDGLSDYGFSPFGEVRRDRQRLAILQGNFVSIFSVFPSAMRDEIGLFDESLARAEDWEYWARAILSGWRVAFQPRIASFYRQQGQSQSSDAGAMLDAEDAMIAVIAERFAGTFTPEEEELLATRDRLGSATRQRLRARDAWREGHFTDGARQLRTAARDFPLYPGVRAKALTASAIAPVLQALPAGFPLRERLKDRW